MSDDVKVRVVITIDLLPPVPEEDLDSYLDYCQTESSRDSRASSGGL